ncbi:MAG: hypothetical protein PF485_11540 [Bacteroidales bacterium]|jgi:hypothetical protein|nr:hypothetical protein [Bacteroidales bacterium]
MRNKIKHTGFAIALAWPETYCKQPGSWYDPITLFLGINKNNYYKVGHAAVVLVDVDKNKFHYFDFGRYHAPFGHGRVRGAETDDDLKIHTIAKISEDGKKIENYKDLLNELQSNPSCHGEGTIHSSYVPVNFKLAFKKAMQMQNAGSIPYGPFLQKGSNCSRFVNTIIRAGKPHWQFIFSLKYLIPLTPTPISNINSIRNKSVLPKLLKNKPFSPDCKLDKIILNSTLKQPEKHPKIPENAQWLSGEGAGSWFDFKVNKNELQVDRYSPDGLLECSGFYEIRDNLDFHNENFKITYPSNCKEVTIVDDGKGISFVRV